MMQVTLQTKGSPDRVLKFSDKQWAAIQAAMKRDGKKSFRAWLIWRINQFPLPKDGAE